MSKGILHKKAVEAQCRILELAGMMTYRSDGSKIVADKNCPAEKIIAPIELAEAILCIGHEGDFDAELKKLDVSGLRYLIDFLSGIGSWNEGVLLCEAEIARRGLHIDDVRKSFEL